MVRNYARKMDRGKYGNKSLQAALDAVTDRMSLKRVSLQSGISRPVLRRHDAVQQAAGHDALPATGTHKPDSQCTHCNGFFSRTHFCRQEMKCKGESAADPTAILAELTEQTLKLRFSLNS